MHDFRIKFFLDPGSRRPGDDRTVQVRIYLDQQRAYLTSTRITVPPCRWDVKEERVKADDAIGRLMNHRINTLRALIGDICRQHEEDTNLSIALIKTSYREYVKVMSDKTGVITFFRQYLEHSRESMDYDPHVRCVQVTGLFEKFVNSVYGIGDLEFADLCGAVLSDFESYLYDVAGYTVPKTISMKMHSLKYLFGAAYELGMMSHDPFDNYSPCKRSPVSNVFLTVGEIRRLRNAVFETPRLERVRDCFLFSCYTGLSYGEAKTLTDANLIRLNGGTWILLAGHAEDSPRYIPLLPYPAALIAKYREGRRASCLLPLISQQKMNKYLKEIGELWGIGKRLTFQLAVRSFTKMALSSGVSMDSVSHMLGRPIRNVGGMVKLSPERIEGEMALFASKMGHNHP